MNNRLESCLILQMMLFAFFMTLVEIVLSLEYNLFVMKDFLVSQINHRSISVAYIEDLTWELMFYWIYKTSWGNEKKHARFT